MSICQKILSFVSFYYLVKTVGADEYGKYLINLATISLLGAIGQPVLVNLVQRNTRYESGVAYVEKQLVQFLIALSIILGVTTFSYLTLLSSTDNITKKLIFLIIICTYVETICSILLRVCEKFIPALLYDMVLQYSIILLLFYIITLNDYHSTAETLLLIKCSTVVIGLITTFILMMKYSSIKIVKNNKSILTNLIQEYLKLFKFSILKYLMVPTVILLVSYYLSDSDVTYFRFLSMLVGFAGFVQTPLNVVIGPTITKSINNRDGKNIRKIYARSLWLGLSSSATLGVIITIIYHPIFVKMGFDNSFYDMTTLLILLASQVVKTGFGSVNLILNLSNNSNYSSTGMLLQLVITYLLIWILVDHYFLLGVCIAVSSGMLMNNAYIGIKMKNLMNDITNKI